MAVANTLAYYVTATITAVKSFIVQAQMLDLAQSEWQWHGSNHYSKLKVCDSG